MRDLKAAHELERLDRDGSDLLILSSMCGWPDPLRSVRDLGRVPCPLFLAVRNPRRPFAPMAPSVAPTERGAGTEQAFLKWRRARALFDILVPRGLSPRTGDRFREDYAESSGVSAMR